jgi:hypothetical protein
MESTGRGYALGKRSKADVDLGVSWRRRRRISYQLQLSG